MINLSNRGFPMLHVFAGGNYITYAQALRYDQRPFRSMLVRKYIEYHPSKKAFKITEVGLRAWEEFTSTEIDQRKDTRHLTAFFDAARWGFTDNVRVMKKAG